MKLIVFSPTKSVDDEINWVKKMFRDGLETYHLKKPHYNNKRMQQYLNKIPSEYHSRIVIHSHHKLVKKYNLKGIHFPSKYRKKTFKTWWLVKRVKHKKPWLTISTSFHSTTQLYKEKSIYDYVFLSPIFDSITKKNYQSGFNEFSLTGSIQKSSFKVIALGGVHADKIDAINKMGFYGCALLGTIWTNEDPLKVFNEVKTICNQLYT